MTIGRLRQAFEALTPRDNEAGAITALVNAYATYAADAQAATPILAGGINLGKAQMTTALAGMSAPGQGATKLTTAIKAFWTAVAAGLTVSFAGATAITAPSQTLTAADVQPVFDANTSGGASLIDSAAAIAAAIHAKVVGGSVTTAGPTVTPIT